MACYELLLRAEFSAAHQLRLENGELEPLHGHNWRVEVSVTGPEPDPATGMVADFTRLLELLEGVTGHLHDTFLNELPPFSADNPSTERIAKHIHDALAPQLPEVIRISKVRVWETARSAAAYLP